MLFIGRTIIRKHNWAERRMDGGRAGGGGGDPETCAYYSWNLTVITESILCKCARLRAFPPRPMKIPPTSSLGRKEKKSRGSDVLVQFPCAVGAPGAPLSLSAADDSAQHSYSRM